MKLKDKETGAILDDCRISLKNKWGAMAFDPPKTLKELNERFEDVEEPKEYWCIDWTGGVNHITVLDVFDSYKEKKEEIGNYFETKEEAEKAVEKLKAWKRLRDKGFRFTSWDDASGATIRHKDVIVHKFTAVISDDCSDYSDDIDLLFGGEE